MLERWLQRIAECEPEVHAWTVVDPRPPTSDGLLNGVPFGVKDVIETAGMPTEYGSPLYAGRLGEFDADVVARLRALGAVLLGKTQTAAFASFDPPPTRNPRAPGHTPGGSSSGSAAAVAAGMTPYALGAQTLGSVLRPASYCGVCGFKPTFGRLPVHGVLPFAPSLDTVGLFADSASAMQWLWSRAFGSDTAARVVPQAAALEIPVEAAMKDAFTNALVRLRATGCLVATLDPPPGFDRLIAAAFTINDYEGARTHEDRWRTFGDRIGAKLSALVERGLAAREGEYRAALDTVAGMKSRFTSLFREYPVILTPAAPGPPPAGLDSTGDPRANAPWTALGVPAISLPMPVEGLPLGLQIVAAWGEDDALVAAAAGIERNAFRTAESATIRLDGVR